MAMAPVKRVALTLRRLRTKQQMSQAEFAAKARISRGYHPRHPGALGEGPRRADHGAARVSAPVDREQLRRELSDALSAIQLDHDVGGLDALAASLQTLDEPRMPSAPGCCRKAWPRCHGTTAR
jgi:hypothetical protein